MNKIAIIADDLTGASDTGVQLCKFGLKTIVAVDYRDFSLGEVADVLSINANTRLLSRDEAYSRVHEITKQLQSADIKRIYKKIDSTLRGHPGVELDAVMDALGVDLALVVPAFPANGRIMIDGNLYLKSIVCREGKQGVEFAGNGGLHESLCHVPSILQKTMSRQVANIDLNTIGNGVEFLQKAVIGHRLKGTQVLVFDAASEKDLALIASVGNNISEDVLYAGAAGLAAHLPVAWDLKLPDRSFPANKNMLLFIIGSTNPVTSVQVEELLKQKGSVLVEVDTGNIIAHGGESEIQNVRAILDKLIEKMDKSGLMVIAVDSLFSRPPKWTNPSQKEVENSAIAGVLGEIAATVLDQVSVNALVITGGDTAKHVCQTLGARGIELESEVFAGIPKGKILGGKAHDVSIVTKAGGFGYPDTFIKLVENLKPNKTIQGLTNDQK